MVIDDNVVTVATGVLVKNGIVAVVEEGIITRAAVYSTTNVIARAVNYIRTEAYEVIICAAAN